MTLPTQGEVASLDFGYLGQPFAVLVAFSGATGALDFGYLGQPLGAVHSTEGASLPLRRALILVADGIAVLPIGQEGTGKKPLVLVDGLVQERVANEGVPIIWDGVKLRTLDPATEELVV